MERGCHDNRRGKEVSASDGAGDVVIGKRADAIKLEDALVKLGLIRAAIDSVRRRDEDRMVHMPMQPSSHLGNQPPNQIEPAFPSMASTPVYHVPPRDGKRAFLAHQRRRPASMGLLLHLAAAPPVRRLSPPPLALHSNRRLRALPLVAPDQRRGGSGATMGLSPFPPPRLSSFLVERLLIQPTEKPSPPCLQANLTLL
nr:unnamed protein product [Digitaria exilis]